MIFSLFCNLVYMHSLGYNGFPKFIITSCTFGENGSCYFSCLNTVKSFLLLFWNLGFGQTTSSVQNIQLVLYETRSPDFIPSLLEIPSYGNQWIVFIFMLFWVLYLYKTKMFIFPVDFNHCITSNFFHMPFSLSF